MDIKSGRIATKYAQAFFNLYGQQLHEQDFWIIKNVIMFLAKNKTVLIYFNTSNLSERQKIKQIFLTYFRLHSNFGSLLILLQKHQRLELLSDILQEILEIFLIKSKQIFFKLSSYPVLLPDQTKKIINYLKQATGHDILYEILENPNLIAGLKVQSTQLLYSDSIEHRLQKIHRKFIRQN